MAAIQTKQSEAYFLTSSNNTGTACKFLVEQMVSMNPDLSIATVSTNTAATYKALVRVTGSNVGFQIYNSSDCFYILPGAWKANGSFATDTGVMPTEYSGSFFSVAKPGTYVTVSSAGVDGVLKEVVFTTSSGSQPLGLQYGMFTSDTSTDAVYVCGAYTSSNISSNWRIPSPLWLCASLPYGAYIKGLDAIVRIRYPNEIHSTPWQRAGFPYVLKPVGSDAYSDTEGFLNLKWGGAYNLYSLLDSAGSQVKTSFGETVSINGVSMQSAGYVSVIE